MTRRKILSAICALALLGAPASAQVTGAGQWTVTGSYLPVAGSQFALAVTTATALTVPAGARLAQICVETAGVRYRDDGTNATASVGMPVASGSCFQYAGNLAALNFTAQSGSPTLDVIYYK